MFTILLAEDEGNLRTLIKKNLELRGYNVTACKDGHEAFDAFELGKFDLLITDIMMPGMDGDTLVHKVKETKKDMPVIMLTALGSIHDKQKSFTTGADDYLVKPVDYDELALRVSALLRRYNLVNQKNITHNESVLDFEQKTMRVGAREVELTKKEFLLLYMLCSSPGRIYSRTQILDEVWGMDSDSMERTVDVHVNKLREKAVGTGIEIVTVRGLGYKAVLR